MQRSTFNPKIENTYSIQYLKHAQTLLSMATKVYAPTSVLDTIPGAFNIETSYVSRYNDLKEQERLLISIINGKLAQLDSPMRAADHDQIRRDIAAESDQLSRIQTELANLVNNHSEPRIAVKASRWTPPFVEERIIDPYSEIHRRPRYVSSEYELIDPVTSRVGSLNITRRPHYEYVEPLTTVNPLDMNVMESTPHYDTHVLNTFLEETNDTALKSLINWIKDPVKEDNDLKYHFLFYLMTLPLLPEFKDFKWNIIRDEFFKVCPDTRPTKDMLVKAGPDVIKTWRNAIHSEIKEH